MNNLEKPGPEIGLLPDMVQVIGGRFPMGNTENDESDQKPVHLVKVNNFYIGKYEITVGQFAEFIRGADYITTAEQKKEGMIYDRKNWIAKPGVNWRYDSEGEFLSSSSYSGPYTHVNKEGVLCSNSSLEEPVIHVSWEDAAAYCRWLSAKTGKKYRLPTEAEWEYAAKGGIERNGNQYSGGKEDSLREFCWFDENSLKESHTVGLKRPNELNIFDMSGNVAEWCADWYGADYYKNSPANNPTGPATGEYHVIRGGSWYSDKRQCTNAYRFNFWPTYSYDCVGFRVVCSD